MHSHLLSSKSRSRASRGSMARRQPYPPRHPWPTRERPLMCPQELNGIVELPEPGAHAQCDAASGVVSEAVSGQGICAGATATRQF
jgi:hypothetical protein